MKNLFHKHLATLALACAAGAALAVPTVSNVSMQRQAGTRNWEIRYDLSGEPAIITLEILTNGVPIPATSVAWLTGDASKLVQPGEGRTAIWNAGADWPEHEVATAAPRITAWATNAPPLYCAVDLTTVWSYEASFVGPRPIYYYTSAEAVPGGVTNMFYKTNVLLMRRIDPTPAEGFLMFSQINEVGIPYAERQRRTWLTKPYYIGVYEVTQGQWRHLYGPNGDYAWPSYFTNPDYRLARPVEQVSYNLIRESDDNQNNPNVDWPQNSNAGGFMGRLRGKTGNPNFDLPTEAQWEYACRAGTVGALNDGTMNVSTAETGRDPNVERLARTYYNGGENNNPPADCGPTNGTAIVGSYLPNAWGLYDMHGNVYEWCLDRFKGTAELMGECEDPKGPVTGSSRVLRGGGWNSRNPTSFRSAYRFDPYPNYRYNTYGFRVVLNLP